MYLLIVNVGKTLAMYELSVGLYPPKVVSFPKFPIFAVKPTTTKECGASIACDFREVEMERVKNNIMIFSRFILLKIYTKDKENEELNISLMKEIPNLCNDKTYYKPV